MFRLELASVRVRQRVENSAVACGSAAVTLRCEGLWVWVTTVGVVVAAAAVVVVWQPAARSLLFCGPQDKHLVAPSLLRAGDSMVFEVEVVMLDMAEARWSFRRGLLSTSPC